MQDCLERYADLIINFGANVQPGQILDVGSGLGKEELTRALTASAYKRGAKFVDVNYWDPFLKRLRVQHAAEDVLDFVPPWYGERTLQLGQERGALKGVAEQLTERRFDAIHLQGDGTDLTVGLLPTSRWVGGAEETVDGISHMANLPTEEVFTTPDPERVDGVVRATKPLYSQGRIFDGLAVRFEDGRAVQVDADSGAETLRALVAQDDGGTRLGELALVDREGRIGALDTVFYDTLLDENAASHIALGSAYEAAVEKEDLERINRSSIHIDFMIGSDDVDVTGITRDGDRVPVLRDSAWQL